MDWLLLNFLVRFLRSDYRGLLCPACKTSERLTLSREELSYIGWTANHSPEDSGTCPGRFAPAPLIRIMVGKIEYHGEFSLQSRRYLPEFR